MGYVHLYTTREDLINRAMGKWDSFSVRYMRMLDAIANPAEHRDILKKVSKADQREFPVIDFLKMGRDEAKLFLESSPDETILDVLRSIDRLSELYAYLTMRDNMLVSDYFARVNNPRNLINNPYKYIGVNPESRKASFARKRTARTSE